MINFRYHIVSITAVFLALAIGTALGSTFLDGPTVDLLNRNIRNAEDRIEATNAENSRLSQLNDQAREREESLLADASGRLVSGLLIDVPVVVFVAPGVETDAASGVTQVIDASGGELRGTVTMLEPMRFEGDLDEELAAELGLEVDDQSELGDEVYRLLHEAMAAAGQPASDAPSQDDPEGGETEEPTTTEPGDDDAGEQTDDEAPDAEDETDGVPTNGEPTALDGTQPSVVTELVERGYLAIDRPDGAPEAVLETEGYRYVLVSDGAPGPADQQAALRLITAGDTSLPLVVVAPTPEDDDEDDDTDRTGLVGVIRGDDELEDRISTVDAIDTFSSLIAMMIALDDVHVTAPGHYGQAGGASSVVPTPR